MLDETENKWDLPYLIAQICLLFSMFSKYYGNSGHKQ